MKKRVSSLLLLSLFTGVLFAQEHSSHGGEHHHSRAEDREASYTLDPFGNVVESVTDPVNPEWVPGIEEVHYEPVNMAQYMAESEARAERLSKAGIKIVRVYLAVDTEYIKHRPDWMARVITIFHSSTGAFIRDAGIFLILGGILPWDSNGDNNSQILADLASDFSGLPDGLVAGFTRDANFTAGGKAYVYQSDPGLGFSVCYDQSINSTIYAFRHEISHNYGMSHDEDNSVCMMNYDYAYSVDYWDSAHENQLNANSDRFGAMQ